MSETVTVCDACGRKSCWEGVDLCEDSRTAGTVDHEAGCPALDPERAGILRACECEEGEGGEE